MFRIRKADPDAGVETTAPAHTLEATETTPLKAVGASRIEAFYAVFGHSWKLWGFCAAFAIWTFAISLSSDTTYSYLQFATSSFEALPVIGTISIVTSIMSGVTSPFWAELADMSSRPIALTASTFFYTLGYIITAASHSVASVCAGQVIYTLGNSGLEFFETLLVADLTPLQWRGFAIGVIDLSYIPFAFVAGYITDGVTLQNWRWGFGMFCIIMPVCLAPIILTLFWADRKAYKMGYVVTPRVAHVWNRVLKIDVIGLLLAGFAFTLLLAPASLSSTASNGWKNPSLIAMQTVGGVIFIALIIWEGWFASHPIMPRRVLNRTFVICVTIEFLYELGSNLTDTFWSSRVYVIKDYSTRNFTYMNQIETVTVCSFGMVAGIIQRYTHRYKRLQIVALAIRIIGAGLNYWSSLGHYNTATLFWAQFLLNVGGCMSVTCSTVASQASVPHQDLAIAVAVLGLWASLGGSVGSAISTAVWTEKLGSQLSGLGFSADDIPSIVNDVDYAKAADQHDLIIQAFNGAYRFLCIGQLTVVMVPFILAFFTEDLHLGTQQNAREETWVAMTPSPKSSNREHEGEEADEEHGKTAV